MSYFDDANSLLQHAEKQLPQIKAEYESSLSKKEIDTSLLIDIKNFMENLRSALDFSAHGLFDAYGSSSKAKPNIYFPYAALAQDITKFRQNKRIERCIPGISASRPDIASKLETFQHFSSPDNKWLPIFMDLNNENKHQQLTPQERKETKQLNISSGGAGISLGEGASIQLGAGSSIQIGGMTIPGGQTISTKSPASTIGPGQQTLTRWVSFNFTSNNEPVLPLLQKSLTGIKSIVNELSKI